MLPATTRRTRARARAAVATSVVALLGAGAVVLPVTAAQAVEPFPIEDPFADMPVGTTMPEGWNRIASDAAQAAVVDDGAAGKWLRLTDNANSRYGGVYNSVPYDAENGLSVEFDMRMYSPTDTGYADGMSFFLQDASVPLDRIGPIGGALGYYSDSAASTPACSAGLPGGVVGLGFDRYGNYQKTQTPNAVTLRGSATNCYLVLKSTGNKGNGYLESRGKSSADAPYRHVKLDIVPTDGGKVRVLVGMSPFTELGKTPTVSDTVLDTELQASTLPSRLRLGFAASTGGAAEYHEIRGITARQPGDVSTTASVQGAATGLVPGQRVTVAVASRNAGPATIGGPADAFARTAADLSDLGLDDIAWTCTAVGGAECATASGTGPDLAVDWTGPAGSGIDVTVTGTVKADQPVGTTTAQFASVTDFAANRLDPSNTSVTEDRSVSDTDLTNNAASVSLGIALEQPSAADDTATTGQGEAVAIDVVANDEVDRTGTDPSSVELTDEGLDGVEVGADGKTLTVPGEGSYSVAANGTVTFTPVDTFIGTTSPVTYRVSSNGGQQATATITVTVRAGDVSAADDSATTGQGVAKTIDVLANDTADASGFDRSTLRFDGDGATDGGKTLVIAGQGTWTVTNGGRLTFTPLATFIGTTTVHYDVTTKAGQHVGAVASVTVTGDAVSADDDRAETGQGVATTLDVLANDTADASGFDAGSVRLTAPEATDGGRTLVVDGQGTWTVTAAGALEFAPVATFIGSTTADYSATTAAGQVVSAKATVEVQGDPVSAADDSETTVQAVPVRVDVLADDTADVSGFDPATLDLDGSTDGELVVARQGTFRVEDGAVVFTPLDTFIGTTDPVRYSARTFAGQSVDGTLHVEVTPGAVSAADDDASTAQGSPVDVDVLTNDAADPSGFDVDSLRLRAVEGATLSDDGRELVVDGQGTWSVVDGGRVRFTPDVRFLGEVDPIRYEVATNAGQVVSAHVLVTVDAAPVAAADDVLTTAQDEPGTVDVLANDTADPSGFDRSSLRFAALPEGTDGESLSEDGRQLVMDGQGTWTIADGEVRFTPLVTFIGSAGPVTYSVATFAGQTVSASVAVTVSAAPVAAADDPASTTQGEPVRLDVLANDEADPSGFDPSTLALTTGQTEDGATDGPDDEPAHGSLTTEAGVWSIVDGVVEFRPTSRFTGTTPEVGYTVETFAGQRVRADITVDVHPVGPRMQDDTATTAFGQPVTVDVTANDRPGIEDGSPIDPESLVLLDDRGVETKRLQTADGVYVVRDGAIEFTPSTGTSGVAAPVAYRVSDSAGAPGTARLTVTVQAEALAFTGATVLPVVLVAAGALLLGGLLLAVVRMRRRRV